MYLKFTCPLKKSLMSNFFNGLLSMSMQMGGSSNIVDKSGGTSAVQLSNASNGVISAKNSKLNICGSSNFTVAGDDHRQVSLSSSSNIKVQGTQGDLQLESCSNTKLDGDGNKVRLNSCSNTSIGGDNNDVKAKNSSNLAVKGNGNHIDVKDISNHKIQPSHTAANVLELTVTGSSGNMSYISNGAFSTVGGGTTTIINSSGSYTVSAGQNIVINGVPVTERGTGLMSHINTQINLLYANTLKIVGSQYDMGIFRFNMDRLNPNYNEIKVDPASIDVQRVTPKDDGTAVEIEGRGKADGTVQTLELKGPSVVPTDSPLGFRVYFQPQRPAL